MSKAGIRYLLLFSVFAVSFLIAFLIRGRNEEYVVVISKDGFQPQKISIRKGTQVTWAVEGDLKHWPASDIHPLHNSYPVPGGCLGSKLDACKPIGKGERYSFNFENAGNWGMHDHLNPQLTMHVTVADDKIGGIAGRLIGYFDDIKSGRDKAIARSANHMHLFSLRQKKLIEGVSSYENNQDLPQIAAEICSDLSGSKFREGVHCYSEVFYAIAINTDSKTAFKILETVRNIDPKAQNCHLIAHGIGWAAYENDPENWKDSVGKMSPECSYGGIHGIVEKYSALSGTSLSDEDLKNVCSKSHNWACYHAIGHIIIVQEKNDLETSADMCNVYAEKMPRYSCLNGVFMEHMIGQNLAEHGFVTFERRKNFSDYLDEFEELCLEQKGDYARACWTEIIHASVRKYNNDTEKIYSLCDRAQTRDAAMSCRRHALAEIASSNKFEAEKVKPTCTIKVNDDPGFEKECYLFIASVIMSNVPDKVDSIVLYCKGLDKEYQGLCFERIKKEIGLLNSRVPERARRICEKIPRKESFLCDGNGQSEVIGH